MYGTTHLYKFADGSGNKITWFTSNDQSLEVGDSLVVKVATIKKHDTYNGEKHNLPKLGDLTAKFVTVRGSFLGKIYMFCIVNCFLTSIPKNYGASLNVQGSLTGILE